MRVLAKLLPGMAKRRAHEKGRRKREGTEHRMYCRNLRDSTLKEDRKESLSSRECVREQHGLNCSGVAMTKNLLNIKNAIVSPDKSLV